MNHMYRVLRQFGNNGHRNDRKQSAETDKVAAAPCCGNRGSMDEFWIEFNKQLATFVSKPGL
ncbi:MAG: hypothetical protein ACR5K7_06610 [Symbiopectobacterium sp.]